LQNHFSESEPSASVRPTTIHHAAAGGDGADGATMFQYGFVLSELPLVM